MKIKHSVITGFLGRQVDRFTEYQPSRTFAEKVALAQKVVGLQGLEVVYPVDFDSIPETIKLVRESGLKVSAVNLNLKQDIKWRRGSLTAPEARIRADAVAELIFRLHLAEV